MDKSGRGARSSPAPRGTAVLDRGLRVLDILKEERRSLSLAELADLSGLDKATLLRYLHTLAGFRLVHRGGDRYSLGLTAFDLGASYLAQLDLHRLSRPHMEVLAEALGETISLAILDGVDVVYVEVIKGQAEIGVQSRIGARQQAHCTSLGKSLTAWLPRDKRARILYANPLRKMTPRTLTRKAEIEAHLARVRDQGYAIDDEERAEGIRCVGAPIRDRSGSVVAAMSVSGPAFRLRDDALDRARVELLQATKAISEALGAGTDAAEPRAASGGARIQRQQ